MIDSHIKLFNSLEAAMSDPNLTDECLESVMLVLNDKKTISVLNSYISSRGVKKPYSDEVLFETLSFAIDRVVDQLMGKTGKFILCREFGVYRFLKRSTLQFISQYRAKKYDRYISIDDKPEFFEYHEADNLVSDSQMNYEHFISIAKKAIQSRRDLFVIFLAHGLHEFDIVGLDELRAIGEGLGVKQNTIKMVCSNAGLYLDGKGAEYFARNQFNLGHEIAKIFNIDKDHARRINRIGLQKIRESIYA